MPPEAIISRNSNWPSRHGTITGWPHLVQARVSNGGRSPGIQLLALHAPQMALRNGLRGSLDVSDTPQRYQLFAKRQGLLVRFLNRLSQLCAGPKARPASCDPDRKSP